MADALSSESDLFGHPGKGTTGGAAPTPPNAVDAALAEFPVYSPPERLYHQYRPDALDRLRDGKLNLTPPLRFNDPFEMWAGISDDVPEQDVLRSVCSKHGIFRKAIAHVNPSLLEDEEQFEKRAAELVRGNPDGWVEHLDSCVRAIRSTLCEGMGVCCFSAFSDADLAGPIAIRHWAVYGANHQGFCVEYDGQHEFFRHVAQAKWLFPVEYRSTRLLAELREFDEWTDEKMWKIFRQWSAMKCKEAWGDEREWRAVCAITGTAPFLSHETDASGGTRHYFRLWHETASISDKMAAARAIRRVILGYFASDSLKAGIREVLEQPHMRHVGIWQAAPSRREFALRFRQLR